MSPSPLPLPLTHHYTNTSTSASTAAERWKAVVYRDASNNTFVYAVRSTRIYCRPSCPARLARRANIEFYETPAAASAAGYRACKRCKPEALADESEGLGGGGGGEGGGGRSHSRIVAKARDRIASAVANGLHRPTLRELAKEAGLTPSHFHRVFKKVAGVTPGQYANNSIGGASGAASGIATLGNQEDDMMMKTMGFTEGTDSGFLQGTPEFCQEVGFSDTTLTFDDLINWEEFNSIESSLS